MKISDMSAQAPVGTTLALLERMLKVMSAVQARVHYAFKQELKLLAAIIRDYTDDSYEYQPEDGMPKAKRSDYDQVEIIPVSDPNAATMSQRVVQYQAVIQLAQQAPQIYDLQALHRQMLEVLGIKNVAKLIPNDDDKKPKDPVMENMDILKGTPAKAFIYQDHKAHIQTHMALIQDPQMQQMIQQNPMASQILGSVHAHIAEHMGFEYRRMVEEQLGAQLPAPDQELPEQLELQVSRLVAEASQRVVAISQAQMAQQDAEQKAQDPVLQMQMQQIQLEAQEIQRKAMKDQAEVQLKQAELQLREKEMSMKAVEIQNEQAMKAAIAENEQQLRAADIEAKRSRGG